MSAKQQESEWHGSSRKRRRMDENARLSRQIGARLQQVRTALNISLSQVAASFPMRIHKSHLSEWERGLENVPIWAVRELAPFYGVSTDYLLCLTDEPSEMRHELEFSEALHTISRQYLNRIAASVGNSIGRQAVLLQSYRDVGGASERLCDAVERMIELNPDYFETEIRAGARVTGSLEEVRRTIALAKSRASKTPLAIPPDDDVQPSLNFIFNIETESEKTS